jgi:hypothetical protein
MGPALDDRRASYAERLRGPGLTGRLAALASLTFDHPAVPAEVLAELEPLLRPLADDPDRDVRAFAPWVLDLLYGPDGCPRLPDRLRHSDWRVRFRAAALVNEFFDPARDVALAPDLGEALAGLLREGRGWLRRLAFIALGQLGPAGPAVEDAIAAAVPTRVRQRPDDEYARRYAAHALGAVGARGERAVAALLDLVSADGPGQEEAATALGHLGPSAPAEVAEWLDLLAAGTGRVSRHALFALASVAPARALARLRATPGEVEWRPPAGRRPRGEVRPAEDTGRRVLSYWRDWPFAERVAWSIDGGLSDYVGRLRESFGSVIDPMPTARYLDRERHRAFNPKQVGLGPVQYYQAAWQVAARALARRRGVTRHAPLLAGVSAAELAARAEDGRISRPRLELAAYTGHPAACEAVGQPPGSPAREWYCGLARFGHAVMTRAHVALGYLVLPVAMLEETDLAPGLALLDIEGRVREPPAVWPGIVDARPSRWCVRDTLWGAASAIAGIPAREPDPAADARVFDHGVQGLSGKADLRGFGADGPAGCARRGGRFRPRLPPEGLVTCPAFAAPELIRRMVGAEVALWALGLFDPLSDAGT